MTFPYMRHTAPGQTMVISLLVLGFLVVTFVAIGISSLVEDEQATTALYNKTLAASAATGCMEQAMDKLGRDATYAGNETLVVASSTCRIRPVIVGSGIWTIETTSTVSNQYAKYRAILSSQNPIHITSWTEITGF